MVLQVFIYREIFRTIYGVEICNRVDIYIV